MSQNRSQKSWVFEAKAARYRALMNETRDPKRRQMLQEMVDRELSAVKRFSDDPQMEDTTSSQDFS